MAVHLVHRSRYEGLAGKRVLHCPEATVLEWFRSYWHAAPTGLGIPALDAIFETLHGLAHPPKTQDELWAALGENARPLREVSCQPHAVEMVSDDGESVSYFSVMDDTFVQTFGDELVAYLLREEWELPTEALAAGRKDSPSGIEFGFATPATHLVFVSPTNRETHFTGFYSLPGLRLPEFVRHLTASPVVWSYLTQTVRPTWPFELWLLRSQLLADEDAPTPEERAFLAELRERPREQAGWHMYSDWLTERGELPAGTVLLRRALERVGRLPARELDGLMNKRGFYAASIPASRRELEEYVFERARHRRAGVPSLSVCAASDHVAQLALHYDRLESPTRDVFHQWYLFDDLWAAAHPALANGLLRYARRWDVLTVEDSTP